MFTSFLSLNYIRYLEVAMNCRCGWRGKLPDSS